MTPGTAREALVAELLGDTARLLDRVDAVMPKLEAAAKHLEAVTRELPAATETAVMICAKQVGELCDVAAKTAVAKTNENAEVVLAAQTAEMRMTAKSIFDKEVTPPLRDLTHQLREASRQSRESWNPWLTHVLTALVTLLLIVSADALSPAVRARATDAFIAEAPAGVQPAPESANVLTVQPAPPTSKSRARH